MTTVTQFIHAKISLWDDLAFYVDGNSKITWDNGTFDEPKPNAFSLPHIATCPGSTERCRSLCYVNNLKKYAPDVYRTYELNEMALHSVLGSTHERVESTSILADWIAENARGGFRWHVSGDIFSSVHAHWITNVCRRVPEIPFWIYTRSLSHVFDIREAPNLAVNISADKNNYDKAVSVAERTNSRICYLMSAIDEAIPELPPGSVIFPDYPLRGRSLPIATEAPWWKTITQEQKRMTCPADFYGQSENHRCGPCKHCLRPAGQLAGA